jgi:hypothetical protein
LPGFIWVWSILFEIFTEILKKKWAFGQKKWAFARFWPIKVGRKNCEKITKKPRFWVILGCF